MKRALVRGGKGLAKQVLRRALSASTGPLEVGLEPFGLEARGAAGLALDGVALHPLTAEWGSPLHVVSAARLRENAREFLATRGPNGAPDVYYSYKTNPVPGVLSLLHEQGIGAEVISHYELWLARRLGVPGNRIVYNGPAKSDESIREAVRLGIHTLNVNHREELARVARIASEEQRRLRVGVRITLADGWSAQFGTPVEGGAALALFREARAFEWLEVVGVHAHRGGMIRTEGELLPFVDGVLDFAEALRHELGLSVELLNLGGSLGSRTVRPLELVEQRLNRAVQRPVPIPDAGAALSIGRHVELVMGRVQSRYLAAGLASPRIVLEPGRSMTSNTQLLLATVLSTKSGGPVPFAILDAGINHAESVRSEYHALLPVNRHGDPADHVYTVVGPICTPGDTLYPAARLPGLHAGDTLAILDAGAYFVPFGTSFSFPQPAIVLVDGGRARLLRRAERFEDIVALDAP